MSDPFRVRELEKKIDALIDRAVHPNTGEHEARNCAFQACKLIREHKFRLTTREPIAGIDVPPEQVWNETVKMAKEDAAKKLEDMAETLFGGTFNPFDFVRDNDKPSTPKVGYIQTRASSLMKCDCCKMQINSGQTILQEFGQNAQKGSRRVTCMKDRCRASWGSR